MDLDELLAISTPTTCKRAFPIEGLGKVTVFELTAAERVLYFEDAVAGSQGSAEPRTQNAFVKKWLRRLLAGPAREPAEGEIDKLLATLSQRQIDAILQLGFHYDIDKATKK